MDLELISVKEYAENRGKSVQAVYQQLKRKDNAQRLEGHIVVKRVGNKDTKFLDAVAVEILDEASRQAPQVIMESMDKERIAELEAENKMLVQKIVELQEQIIERSKKVEMLQEANILLLEQKQERMQEQVEEKKGFWSRIFARKTENE